MNEPQAFAQTDAEWLASINRARDWFQGPLGSLMLAEERRLLCDELTRYFGGYLVHYGPHAELPPSTGQIQRGVRLGPPLPGVDIACEEGAWPLSEHAADVVLLQHGLDFCLSPHRLLREAARTVRPACDWLNLLGFALEKRRFGCYRPPLASAAWQSRLARLERWGDAWQSSGAGFYLLVARKLVVGLRPLRQSKREPRGQLVPMPVAKVSRRDSEI
ncbi:SAM-dependent methyltransferase [Pseudomonas aeruginosa]|uniref:SAM-dependent methyltransferase n=1 Tax=Pseudomonas aeruginosa TaxID=287 RepID=UPI001068BBFB|nr:SAM-dependent methyltransferase [Pseudomonas aeruginosa]TEB72863.1 SAM-dependent methyltransferase [Pseudomonas aeruginosa]